MEEGAEGGAVEGMHVVSIMRGGSILPRIWSLHNLCQQVLRSVSSLQAWVNVSVYCKQSEQPILGESANCGHVRSSLGRERNLLISALQNTRVHSVSFRGGDNLHNHCQQRRSDREDMGRGSRESGRRSCLSAK